jgi:hypothetical protein
MGGACSMREKDEKYNILVWKPEGKPVPMAGRSDARNVFGRSKTGIVGSNPTRGMDVCPRFSVLCCPVCR